MPLSRWRRTFALNSITIVSAVPEPSSYTLLAGLGALVMAVMCRRRFRSSSLAR